MCLARELRGVCPGVSTTNGTFRLNDRELADQDPEHSWMEVSDWALENSQANFPFLDAEGWRFYLPGLHEPTAAKLSFPPSSPIECGFPVSAQNKEDDSAHDEGLALQSFVS
jgi:hypothetical protein